MKLIEALDLEFPRTIALVGGGGKTSFIFTLAREAAALGKSVLITTTTAMFNPDYSTRDRPGHSRTYNLAFAQAKARMFIGPTLDHPAPEPGTLLVAAKALTARGRKLAGYSPRELVPVLASSRFELVLIEADGARMRPVKAPAAHEPVIPEQTDMVVGCIGLDCLGIPLAEPHVHRPNILAELSGSQQGEPVTEKTLIHLAKSEQGLFKSAGPDTTKMIVLNKADSPLLKKQGDSLGRKMMSAAQAERCLVTCFLNPKNPVVQKISVMHT